LRVAAAFFAERDFAAAERLAAARPPMRPPRLDDTFVSGTPRPEPLLLPPPVSRVHRRPGAPLGLLLSDAALLVTLLDMLGLALLLVGVS
jgi:hypothetical protein